MDALSGTTKLEERLVLSATQKEIPLGGTFELLPLCNMDCKMCFLRLTPEQMKAQGGRLRTAKEWLQLAQEAKEAGLLFLLLTGGEPFLYPEFEELYVDLIKMGLIITINTNGTLIGEREADLLAKYRPRRVNITLYGSSDEVYAKLCKNPKGFTQTMRGIRLLKERNVAVKLNGSVTPDNLEDLENIQRIAEELELALEVDAYMFPSSRKKVVEFQKESRLTPEKAAEVMLRLQKEEMSEEKFMALAKAGKQCYDSDRFFAAEGCKEALPCRAGRSSFWITWQGRMTPCIFMEQPGCSVFEEGFQKSWELIKKERKNLFLPLECSKCSRRSFCTVCGACAYTETGSCEKRPDYMCRLTEEKLRRLSEYAD